MQGYREVVQDGKSCAREVIDDVCAEQVDIGNIVKQIDPLILITVKQFHIYFNYLLIY